MLGAAVPLASAASLPGSPGTALLSNFDFTSPLATSPGGGPAAPPPYAVGYLDTFGVSFSAGAVMVVDLFADLGSRHHVGTFTSTGSSIDIPLAALQDGRFSAAFHGQGGTITYEHFQAVGFTSTVPNFVTGVAVVPEPATGLLFAFGADALAARCVGRRSVPA